ncbi:hypothetical protein F5887DRAFT_926551 [Amanita rubescens]|nr:hypothetical protein F5887DRAFT_926551 [Amanita rubescens]
MLFAYSLLFFLLSSLSTCATAAPTQDLHLNGEEASKHLPQVYLNSQKAASLVNTEWTRLADRNIAHISRMTRGPQSQLNRIVFEGALENPRSIKQILFFNHHTESKPTRQVDFASACVASINQEWLSGQWVQAKTTYTRNPPRILIAWSEQHGQFVVSGELPQKQAARAARLEPRSSGYM